MDLHVAVNMKKRMIVTMAKNKKYYWYKFKLTGGFAIICEVDSETPIAQCVEQGRAIEIRNAIVPQVIPTPKGPQLQCHTLDEMDIFEMVGEPQLNTNQILIWRKIDEESDRFAQVRASVLSDIQIAKGIIK